MGRLVGYKVVGAQEPLDSGALFYSDAGRYEFLIFDCDFLNLAGRLFGSILNMSALLWVYSLLCLPFLLEVILLGFLIDLWWESHFFAFR